MLKLIALAGIAVGAVAVAVVVVVVSGLGDESAGADLGTYDESLVEQLVSDYDLSYETAVFLAMTEFETRAIRGNAYQIDARFPTGNTAQITIEVFPDEVYQPSPSELMAGEMGAVPRVLGLQYSGNETADAFDFRLEYFIPYDSLPDDAVDSLRSAASPTTRSLLQALFPVGRAGAQESGGTNGVKVVAEGAVEAFAWDQLEAFEQVVGQRGNIAGMKQGGITKTVGAVTSVLDSWDLKTRHENRKREMQKLRDCAENPTNPLTQKMYREDPASKERLLQEIGIRQSELNMDTAARFLNAMNSVASGLVPGLGIVVGAASSWVDERIDELSEERLDDVRKMVTPCDDQEQERVTPGWYGMITYVSETNVQAEDGHEREKTNATITVAGDMGQWQGMVTGDTANRCETSAISGQGKGQVAVSHDGHNGEAVAMAVAANGGWVAISRFPNSPDYYIAFWTGWFEAETRYAGTGAEDCGPTSLSFSGRAGGGGEIAGTVGEDPSELVGSHTEIELNTTTTITWRLTSN